MNPVIENLLGAVENFSDEKRINENMYMELMSLLKKYHNETAEGIDAARKQKEQQERENEEAARELAAQNDQTDDTYFEPHIQYEEKTVGNVVVYASYTRKEFLPDHVYHQIDFDGRHTIRNPLTGIFVLLDGDRGKRVLQNLGLTKGAILTLV